jgi:hypothetical protein
MHSRGRIPARLGEISEGQNIGSFWIHTQMVGFSRLSERKNATFVKEIGRSVEPEPQARARIAENADDWI